MLAFFSAKQSSLKISAISSWLPLIINFLVGIFLTPILIDKLGKTPYGIWALVGSLVGYYGLLRLGVGSAIMRYLPYYSSKKNIQKVNEVASSALVFYLFVAVAILFISNLVANSLAGFYQGGSEMAGLIKVMGIAAAFECSFLVFDSIVRARGLWVWANCIITVAAVLRACGLLYCVLQGYGLVSMGWVLVGVNLNSFILFSFMVLKFFPDIQLRLMSASISQFITLMTYGFSSLLIALSLTLTLQGHNLIIGKVLSLADVTIYAVVVILIRNSREAIVAPNRVIFPRFAFLDGEKNLHEIKALFLKASKINSLSGTWVYLCVIILGPSFITLWLGQGFEKAYPALVILGFGFLLDAILAAIPPFMGGIGEQKIMARYAVWEGLIGLGLSYLLTLFYGVIGTAVGFLCSIVFVRGFLCLRHVCKRLQMSYLTYCKNRLLFPLLVLTILYGVSYCGKVAQHILSWYGLVGSFVLLTILYSFFVVLFVRSVKHGSINPFLLLVKDPRSYFKNLIGDV